MKREDMAYVLATGYGRNSLMDLADKQMSELSCHAKGAYFLFPGVRTVIDIGGQDVKIIKVENGSMVNFQMNDKCAAGTGRFLDVMARVLEVEVDQLGDLGAQSTKEASITPTICDTLRPMSQNFRVAMGEKLPVIFLAHPQNRFAGWGLKFCQDRFSVTPPDQPERVTPDAPNRSHSQHKIRCGGQER